MGFSRKFRFGADPIPVIQEGLVGIGEGVADALRQDLPHKSGAAVASVRTQVAPLEVTTDFPVPYARFLRFDRSGVEAAQKAGEQRMFAAVKAALGGRNG